MKQEIKNTLENIFKIILVNLKGMTPSYFKFYLTSIAICINFTVQAQLNINDSLVLVEFYETTDGPNWQDNTNWLSQTNPVTTWFGVTLNADGTAVEAIILPENNLNGFVSESLAQLNQIELINVANNELSQFPDFTNHPFIQEIVVVNNFLGYDSFEPYFEFGPPPFLFAFQNQNFFGPFVDTLLGQGETILIPNYIDGSANQYQWFFNGELLPAEMTLPDGSLQLTNLDFNQAGEYFVSVTNGIIFPFEPSMQLQGSNTIIQVAQLDSLGGLIVPNQLIVKFSDNLHPDTIAAVRDTFMAIKLDSILCRNIELWGLPDTIILPGGDTLIDPEEKKSRVRSNPKVEEVDHNNIADGADAKKINKQCAKHTILLNRCPVTLSEAEGPESSMGNLDATLNDTILIAIIDTGIDTTHPVLNDHIWRNTSESYSGLDEDGNCIIDDVNGFNFNEKNTNIIDVSFSGHGTHVSGIIEQLMMVGNHASFISLNMYDQGERGSLFAMMSGVFYAASKGAKIINISGGYYGVESAILPIAFNEALVSNQTVIVTSAGNNHSLNDTILHWPSNYRLPNVISVAALNDTETKLAAYSNFGKSTVDIAAPGTNILSTSPGGGMEVKSGTSMAAAWVSGVVANLISAEPLLTAEQILNCIKSNSDPIIGGDTSTVTGGKINELSTLGCLNSIVPGIRSKIYLEGLFLDSTSLMPSQLADQGILPTIEPFSADGWPLTEGVGDTWDQINLSHLPVDWAIMELRSPLDSSQIIHQKPILLQTNGHLISPNGDSIISFQNVVLDSFYVALRFRNFLDVISKKPISYNRTHSFFDLTLQPNLALDTTTFNYITYMNAPTPIPLLLGGDTNSDNKIDAADRSNTWNSRNMTGYLLFDVNLDGQINAADRSDTWNNRNKTSNFPN